MNVLVVGGTRFFGIHLVRALLREGHKVTIATRGNGKDEFGSEIERIRVDRTDAKALAEVFSGKNYDVVCDNIAYSSNEVKYLLEAVKCRRYVLTSSISVYEELPMDTKEEGFMPLAHPLKWCTREDDTYDEIKRQAECALFQVFGARSGVAIRFPYVIGEDDYTKRLYFYVEHIIKGIPMFVDNPEEEIAFIKSSEAGDFLAWVAEQEYTGTMNACSRGTVSLQEVFHYVETKTGRKPILVKEGEKGPYNGSSSFSLNTERASNYGYEFSTLKHWFYEVIDRYIEMAKE